MRLMPQPRPFWTYLLTAFPLLGGTAAAILFFRQGGFGGGHGPYDEQIAYLGLPAMWFLSRMPDTHLRHLPDFHLVVVLPCAINLCLWAACGRFFDWLRLKTWTWAASDG